MFTVARFERSVRVTAPHLYYARSFSAAVPSFITLDESSQTLAALTSAHPRVLAYFTATWCGPCRAIAPKFAALAGTHAGVKFVKIDVDDNADTMAEAKISSVPTFISFVDGKPTAQFAGASADKLEAAAAALAR